MYNTVSDDQFLKLSLLILFNGTGTNHSIINTFFLMLTITQSVPVNVPVRERTAKRSNTQSRPRWRLFLS